MNLIKILTNIVTEEHLATSWLETAPLIVLGFRFRYLKQPKLLWIPFTSYCWQCDIVTTWPERQRKLDCLKATFHLRGALSCLRDAVDRRLRLLKGRIMQPEGGVMLPEGNIISFGLRAGCYLGKLEQYRLC